MVRCSLACPHTVASIILIKVIRFLGLSSNCGRVLEDSVSTAIETAIISFVKKPLRDMENPASEPRKSMVRIGAITGIVIRLGLYQLCFLVIILLVGLSTFSKSPLIGGETCVQIAFAIWTRLSKRSIMGPVYYQFNIENLTNINQPYGSTNFMPVSKSRYRRNDAWGSTWFTPYSMPNCKCGEVHSLVVVFPSAQFEESYWTHITRAIPGLSGLGSQ